MLHRPADAEGQIQLRTDGDAGHTHLTAVRGQPRADRRPGSAQPGPQLFCQLFQLGKALPGTDTHAPGHDDLRLTQRLPFRKGCKVQQSHPVGGNKSQPFHNRVSNRSFFRPEGPRPDGGHLDIAQGANVRHQGIAEGRSGLNQPAVLQSQGSAVRRQPGFQMPGQHRHEIAHSHRGRGQNNPTAPGPDVFRQKSGKFPFLRDFFRVQG